MFWKLEIQDKRPAGLVSSEVPLLYLKMATLSLCTCVALNLYVHIPGVSCAS